METGSGVYCPLCDEELVLSGNDEPEEGVVSDNYVCITPGCHTHVVHYWGDRVEEFD